jgi:SAM-dependent methyltransferase
MNSPRCHLCEGLLFSTPILALKGMPKAAQYYPAPEEFAADKGITLPIYQCAYCGLVQLVRTPVDYYREVITAAAFSEKAKASRLAQMKEIVQEHDLEGKRVLELGCGKGDMLDILQEAGMLATGLEGSASSVEIGKAAGRNIIHGYIDDEQRLEGAPFDAFIVLNYLEHMPEPGKVIRLLHQVTTETALGYITVPNLAYILKSRCFYEFVADHLSYFTQSTFTFAFEANGFEVLNCQTINEDNDLALTVRKRKPLDLTNQYNDVETLIGTLRALALDYQAQGKKLAVWGAGHRTLALLALAGLSDVAYVIDSAKFKQGKFTPVLHLKIVPPSQLKNEPVDLVLVMVPGLYPGEVLKTLAGMGIGSAVAALRGNELELMVKE